jgi:hypothetical protein
MDHEHGAIALAEQENQFQLEAALKQGEMLAAHGTDEGRQALTSELLRHSGNLDLAPEDFQGVPEGERAEAELRLAMGMAVEAEHYGLNAASTKDDLRAMYVKAFEDASSYKQMEGVEGYDENSARAKNAFAAAVYRRLETPAAVDLSRW